MEIETIIPIEVETESVAIRKTPCPITGHVLPKKVYSAKDGSGIKEVRVGKLRR